MNNNEKASIKITFDEKKQIVKAKIVYPRVNEKNYKEKTQYDFVGLDKINEGLKAFLRNYPQTLEEMYLDKKITLDEESTRRYKFDFTNNTLVEKVRRRTNRRAATETVEEKIITDPVTGKTIPTKTKEMDISTIKRAIILAIMNLNPLDTFRIVENDKKEVEGLEISKPGSELVLPEGFYYDEVLGITNKNASNADSYIAIKVGQLVKATEPPVEDTITNLLNKDVIISEIIKLNPGVSFSIMRKSDGSVDYLASDKPGSELKLPGKFYYNDKNGITNKGKTTNGLYTAIDVRPLVKAKVTDPVTGKSVPTAATIKDAPTTTSGYVVNDDGSITIDGTVSSKPKEKKNIKKIVLRSLAVLTGLVILVGGINAAIQNNLEKEKTRSNGDTDDNDDEFTITMTIGDQTFENTFNRSDEDYVTVPFEEEYMLTPPIEEDVYDAYGDISYQQTDDQLNRLSNIAVNGNLYSYQFEDYVPAEDYDAVRTINEMRTAAINNEKVGYNFLDTMTRYIFEGSTYVNGKYIKGFNDLGPTSRFIVVRITQGILEKYSDFYTVNGSTVYNINTLADKLEPVENEAYIEATGRGRGMR